MIDSVVLIRVWGNSTFVVLGVRVLSRGVLEGGQGRGRKMERQSEGGQGR